MFTEKLRNDLMNHAFRGIAYEAPAAVYLGLHTETGEVSGTAYERQKIEFEDPADGTMKNTNEVRYPIAGSDWGTVTKLVIYDAPSAGGVMDELTLAPDAVKEIGKNEQPLVPVGGYDMGLIKCE